MATASDLIGQLLAGAQSTGNTNDQWGNPGQSLDQLTAAPQPGAVNTDLSAVPTRAFSNQQMVQKHGLGHILSIMGDIVLANAGLQPQYLPKVQAAKEADAVEGIEHDPVAAIHRLWAVNPGKAQELFDSMPRQAYMQALTRQSVDADHRAETLAPITQMVNREKLFGPAASMVMAASGDKTGKSWPGVRDRVKSYLTARGLDDHLEGLPDTFDPQAMRQWASGAISPDKQVDDNRADAQLDETEDFHAKSLGLRGKEVSNQTENVDDMIRYRAWQKQHGDTTSKTDADYKKWLMDHPSKTRVGGSAPSAPPPPRKVGDKIRAADGSVLVSHDGKTWSK